jgi:xanthine phosphoribosyltransferase
MKLLEERIRKEGKVFPGHILNVGSFLNQQADIGLYQEIGKEFKRLFDGEKITKILTIEASGIGIACITAVEFGVPVLFARKFKGKNVETDVYLANVTSYTHGVDYPVTLSREYLGAGDRVLIMDDFLANGCALQGLVEICGQAGAKIAGGGIVIEKGFQAGGKRLRAEGLRIESLAIIDSMDDSGKIVFRSER